MAVANATLIAVINLGREAGHSTSKKISLKPAPRDYKGYKVSRGIALIPSRTATTT